MDDMGELQDYSIQNDNRNKMESIFKINQFNILSFNEIHYSVSMYKV